MNFKRKSYEPITFNGKSIEDVTFFVYFGSKITTDWDSVVAY